MLELILGWLGTKHTVLTLALAGAGTPSLKVNVEEKELRVYPVTKFE